MLPERSKDSETEQKKKADGEITLIVRRGAVRRFERLEQDVKDLPATVRWDRRRGERREASTLVDGERRKADRRGPPPFTWETADFVVVTQTDGSEEDGG